MGSWQPRCSQELVPTDFLLRGAEYCAERKENEGPTLKWGEPKSLAGEIPALLLGCQ